MQLFISSFSGLFIVKLFSSGTFFTSLSSFGTPVSQSDHIFGNLLAPSSRFAERFLIIFFEIIFLVAFNGNYQFVNLQKTIVSPLFNICIMNGVKNVP